MALHQNETICHREWPRRNTTYFIIFSGLVVFGLTTLRELRILYKPSLVVPTVTLDPITTLRPHFAEIQVNVTESSEELSGIEPERTSSSMALDAVWQPVAGTNSSFYVYSAYVEYRENPSVRIIAATKTLGADQVFCRLWLPDNRTITTRAQVKIINENWHMKYSASFVLCMLRKVEVMPEETVGASVAVIAKNASAEPPTNLLLVRDTKPGKGIENNIHVCVRPVHGYYSHVDWIIEWFEMNQLLGVNHFYLYNQTISKNMDCILEYYQKKGLVTILPWQLPLEIWSQGQLASSNDCLYRSMSTASWLLVIDLDELLLPRQEDTMTELLSLLAMPSHTPAKPVKPSAFLFRNAFFFLHWEDDNMAPNSLVTARKTRRCTTPNRVYERSKYAVQPTRAVELGIHFLWKAANGTASLTVPIDRGLSHHYRDGEGECNPKNNTTVDRTAHRWSKPLLKSVEEQTFLIAEACPSIWK